MTSGVRWLTILLIVSTISGFPRTAVTTQPDARSIVEAAFENLYSISAIQRFEVRTRASDGRALRRDVQIARSPSSEGLDRVLVRFLGPGDLRGVGLLLTERKPSVYDAFVYQPAFRRVRRISVAQRTDPFFGTDITLEDLESKDLSQWIVRRMGDESLGGRPSDRIELVPNSAESSYERVLGWFDREYPIMLRVEFHRDGKLAKVMETDPGRVEWIAGRAVPRRMKFQTPGRSQTWVDVVGIEIRETLRRSLFTRSALEFGDPSSDARP